MIAAVLDKAYVTFCQKSDAEYFETIKAMLNKFALAENGEVIFSAKDLERMPDGFAEEIQKIAAAKGRNTCPFKREQTDRRRFCACIWRHRRKLHIQSAV